MEHGELRIFSGNANPKLAERVAAECGMELSKAEVSRFSDMEIRVKIEESVRGADVFIVQPTCSPCSENLMELLIMIDACRRGSADRITAVVPYYGYSRQDKKTRGREPITARLVANMITVAGADRVMTIDLHADQIMGFFDLPVDHLPARPIIVDYCKSQGFCGDCTTVVSPDVGGVENAKTIADELDCPLAIIAKRRTRPNECELVEVIGQMDGKQVLLVDDMVDTAGTLVQAARICTEMGAAQVHAVTTHAVLSGPAVQRLRESHLQSFVATDTVPIPHEKSLPNLTILSVAPLLADAISCVHNDQSVSKRLADGHIKQLRIF